MQSALDPHGPAAHAIATLGWIMFAGAAAILIVVTVLAALAVFSRRRGLGGRSLVVGAGIAFPVVTLSALLVYGLGVADTIVREEGPALRIEVVGEQWWWRVRYVDEGVVSANEIRIPVGRTVEFSLKSADVIHSFWVPNLAGKLDMIPGHTNRLRLRADRAGVFRGQCAEYCGGPHARMAFYVVAEPPDAFASWLEAERRPAAEPHVALLERGKAVFVANGCGACHTVRGTEAAGTIGPDLTHVGGRLSIGAGMFPNNAGTLAGWIADSQHLKPENRMPPFDAFQGADLRAVASWLESLR